MNPPKLLRLYDTQLRIELAHPGARKEVLPNLVRVLQPAPGLNFIAYSRLDKVSMDSVIEAQIRYFEQLGQPFAWDVCEHDIPPTLRDCLVAHGFVADNDPDAVMLLRIRDALAALLDPVTSDVRRVTRGSELKNVTQVLTQVYGGDFGWLEARLLAHLEISNYVNVYVAYSNDRPVCVGWVYFYPGSQFAGLFGGATLPDFRQQGFYRAVLASRVQAAAHRGYLYLTTGASPMSRPVLARSGFDLLTTTYTLKWGGKSET